MDKNLASVIVTLYNGSRFIEEQLDTLRIQTYPNVEVIIADDGSKDNGAKLVEEYILKYKLSKTWTLVINEVNKGYARNFMESCKLAKGEVIFFCDQDDKWNADKIEKMMSALDEHNEVEVLCSNLIPFTEEEGARSLDQKLLAEMKDDGSVEVFGTTKETFHCKRSGCTMSIRKSYFDSIFPYWTEGWAQDEFVWKMSCIDKGCGILQLYTTNRRMHLNNATNIKERTRTGRIQQLGDMYRWNENLLKYAEDRKASDEIINIIKKYRDSLELRKKLLTKRNPFIWIKLWRRYSDCYPRTKGLYLDLYLVFFQKSKIN